MSRLRQHRGERAADQERDRALAALEASDDGAQRTTADPADWSHMPDEELLRFELRRAVEVAVQELPEIYREPVILRDFEGSTTEEASTRLKVKDQTPEAAPASRPIVAAGTPPGVCLGLTLHRPTPVASCNGSGVWGSGNFGRYCVETNSGRDDRLASAAASSSARRAT